MFGEPLWPMSTPQWTYDELCCACWFSEYYFGLTHRETPPNAAINARHLVKYIQPLQRGFVLAVYAIMTAYELNPNGVKKFPMIPVNFGTLVRGG
jgi:hypothetical protein